MSVYDLSPPTSSYEERSNLLRSLSQKEDSLYLSAERSSDRTRRAESYKHRQKRDRYNHFIGVLGQEVKEQLASRAFTIKRLAREKQHWFAHRKSWQSDTAGASLTLALDPRTLVLVGAIIENCLHPRALLSPMDADYCAQLIKVMHLQGTPGFSALQTYDRVNTSRS